MKRISKMTVLGLLAAALVALPALSRAGDADTNAPGASERGPHGKPDKGDKTGRHGTPFHGKLAAVDAKAMTLNVGTLVIHVTADTKVTKDGKPATLADGVVGEPVGGAYQKADDGQLNATMVHFGAKPEKPPKDPSAAGNK